MDPSSPGKVVTPLQELRAACSVLGLPMGSREEMEAALGDQTEVSSHLD